MSGPAHIGRKTPRKVWLVVYSSGWIGLDFPSKKAAKVSADDAMCEHGETARVVGPYVLEGDK